MGVEAVTAVAWSANAALTDWQHGPFSLLIAAVLVAVGCWYLRSAWRLRAGVGRVRAAWPSSPGWRRSSWRWARR